MQHGSRLRAVAQRFCTPRTMERLIDPVLADMQHEVEHGARAGRTARLLASARAYVAFWKAVSLYLAIEVGHTASVRWRSGRGTTRAGLIAATATLVPLTVLAAAGPLLSVAPAKRAPILVLLLLPATLPFTLPVVLCAGIAASCRRRPVSRRMAAGVVAAALLASIVSFGTISWVLPDTNQAYREAAGGRPLPRGPGEWTPAAIRAQALEMKRDGLVRQAGSLMLEYHLRWALVGTTVTFALLGLALARVGVLAGLIMCALPFCYMHYVERLSTVSSSTFSHETYAIAAAWAPQIVVILAAVGTLAACRGRVECTTET
jgi:hypothetical protein